MSIFLHRHRSNFKKEVILSTVYCCGFNQESKVYNLPAVNCAWKKLFFLNACCVCGQCIAQLKICTKKGEIKIIGRYRGEKALAIRDKIIKEIKKYKAANGTWQNQLIHYNNKGDIYNFNNQKVGKNEDFVK